MPSLLNLFTSKTRKRSKSRSRSRSRSRKAARETTNAENMNLYLRQMYKQRMRNKNMQKK